MQVTVQMQPRPQATTAPCQTCHEAPPGHWREKSPCLVVPQESAAAPASSRGQDTTACLTKQVTAWPSAWMANLPGLKEAQQLLLPMSLEQGPTFLPKV